MPGTLDEINCFISYHRPDNRDYLEVVDRLKAELSGRFEASTGRSLNIFLDRDSIGWGEDWRDRIHDSVVAATFFIPIITMRFFRSDPCREELTTYYENARQLGVTELILPIVLSGASQISASHTNPDVRLIEKLNYIPIEAEWEAGYESPIWRAVVNRMVRELTQNLAKAEAALVEQEAGEEDPEPGSEKGNFGESTEPAADIDLDSLNEAVTEATGLMTASMVDMNAFGATLRDVMEEINDDSTPSQRQSALIRGSKAIGDSASKFADTAARFEEGATVADTQLRGVIRELRDIDTDVSREQLRVLADSTKEFPDLQGHLKSIDDALGGLRLASMTNVSVRKALQPAIRAMQSMRIGMSIAIGWADL